MVLWMKLLEAVEKSGCNLITKLGFIHYPKVLMPYMEIDKVVTFVQMECAAYTKTSLLNSVTYLPLP